MTEAAEGSRLDIVLYTEGLPFTGNTLERQALGGAETACIYVARELARAGHKVTTFCVCPEEGDFDGVEYRDLSKFAAWQQSQACDLFICSRFFHIFAYPISAQVKALWNHDSLYESTFQSLQSVLPAIDYLVCLSDYHVDLFARGLATFNPLIKKSSNGVDFALTEAARAAAKKHQIIYTSRPERGLWRALDIYERLGDKTLELLVCTYNYSDHPEIRAIEDYCAARIAALNQAGFRISVGQFAKRELYRRLAESKAAIYPTYAAEIFCISAIEAQACGTVFMTSEIAALRETVAYPGYDPDDVDGFAQALRHLLADTAARRQLELAGLQHARRFSWATVAQQFIDDALQHIRQKSASRQPPAQIAAAPVRSDARRGLLDPGGLASLTARPDQAAASAHITGRLQRIQSAQRGRANGLDRQRSIAPAGSAARPQAALPKISCLTVTLNRLIQLKQAVRCYCDQTYPNRELVIVTEGARRYRQAIADYLQTLDRSDIRLVSLDGDSYTLGKVRNLALDAAAGELICQWDDDDLNHPERLRLQYEQMAREQAQACYLTDQLHFFARERELYWIDWRRGGRSTGVWELIPGTLMMARDSRFRYPEAGPEARAGEDTALLNALYGQVQIAKLQDAGHLYIYTYHGGNTYSYDHHRALISIAIPVTAPKEMALRASLRHYPLPMPYAIKGPTGQTHFVYNQ